MMQRSKKNAIRSIAFGQMIDKIDANLKIWIEGRHKTVLNHELFPVFENEKLAHRRAISHLTWYETRALVMHYLKRNSTFDVCKEDGLDAYSFMRKLINGNQQTFLRELFEGHLRFREHESNHEDVVLIREVLNNQSYLKALDRAFENLGVDVIYFDWISYRSQDKFWLCPYFGIGRVLSRGISITIQNDVTVYHKGLDFFAVLQQLSADQYDCILKRLYSNWGLYERKYEISFLSDTAAQFQLDTFFAILEVELIKRERVWINDHHWKGFMPVPLGWDSHKTYKKRLKRASEKQDKMNNFRQYYDTTEVVIGDNGGNGSKKSQSTNNDTPTDDKKKRKNNRLRTVHNSDFHPVPIYGWTLDTMLWSIFFNSHVEDQKKRWDKLRNSYEYLNFKKFDEKLEYAPFNQELDENYRVFSRWVKRDEFKEVIGWGGISIFLISMLTDVKKTYKEDITKLGKEKSEIQWFTELKKKKGDPNNLIVKWSTRWTSENGDEARLLYLPHLNGKTRENVHEQIMLIMYTMVVQTQHMSGSMSNLKNKEMYGDTGDSLFLKKRDNNWWEFKDYTLNWPHQDYETREFNNKEVLFNVGTYRLKWIHDNFYYQELQKAKSILDMLLPDPDKVPDEQQDDFNVVFQLPWRSWRGWKETQSAWNMQAINSWIIQYLEELKQQRINENEGSEKFWVPCPETDLEQKNWRFKPDAETINFLSKETGYSEHYLDMIFRYLYVIGERQNDSELKKDFEAKKLEKLKLEQIQKQKQLERDKQDEERKIREAESVEQQKEERKKLEFIETQKKQEMKKEIERMLQEIRKKFDTVVNRYVADSDDERREQIGLFLRGQPIQDETFKREYMKIDSFWMDIVLRADEMTNDRMDKLNYISMKGVLKKLTEYLQFDDIELQDYMHGMIMKIVSERNNADNKKGDENKISSLQSEVHKRKIVRKIAIKYSEVLKIDEFTLTELVYRFFHAYSLLWKFLINKSRIQKTELMPEITGHLDPEKLKEYKTILKRGDINLWIYTGQTEELSGNNQGVNKSRFDEYYTRFFDGSTDSAKVNDLFKKVCVALTVEYNNIQELKRTVENTRNPYFVVI